MKMKTYTRDELSKILELHRLFLENDPSGVQANLKGVNLEDANLVGVNLAYANLKDANLEDANLEDANLAYANLKGANLKGANLDYSCWPLWCGSFDVKVDRKVAAQLAYHFCRLDCDDPEYIRARNAIVKFANKFHRIGEDRIPEIEEI